MRFTQDFLSDFDQIDFFGKPFAFVRFGDGERALCQCAELTVSGPREQWQSDGNTTEITNGLNDALQCDMPGFYIGISCPCCDEPSHRWYLSQVRAPSHRLTYANLFVNANYKRFLAYAENNNLLKRCAIVSSGNGDFRIPSNVVNTEWDIDGLVQRLCEVDRPILLAAGPAAAIIAHRYWQRAKRPQTVVDIGSTLDHWIHGVPTRRYHDVNHPNQKKVCRWSEESNSESDITAIVTVYRRPEYLQRQIDAIRSQTVPPKEIWAWVNQPTDEVRRVLNQVDLDRVVTSSENARFHARFALAQTVDTKYVALFDDDTIPGAAWFENCLSTMGVSPGILGSAGVRLQSDCYTGRSLVGWHAPSDQTVEADLVGHAWFLKTEWASYLFADRPVTGTNGEDIELSARAWRCGQIRTFCPPHPPDDRSRWGSTNGTVLGQDSKAASRKNGHLSERDHIVQAEMERGWKPLFLRNETSGVRLTAKQIDTTDRTQPARNTLDRLISLIPERAKRILLIGREAEQIHQSMERHENSNIDCVTDLHLSHLAKQKPEYDCIVAIGVLERLKEPRPYLEELRRRLTSSGMLVVTASNMRHHSRISSLISGRWPIRIDDSHIRHYTTSEAEKLLYRHGFNPLRTVPLDEPLESQNGSINIGGLHITGISPEDARDLQCGDFAVVAKPTKHVDYGITSVVMLTHNQLAYTQMCLESLRFRTDHPLEIIVVDNASTDGTVEYLRSQTDVVLIENAENVGFPAGANQGIRTATGDNILLLNNDVLLTTGWLERMLHALYSGPRVGMVGPYSNCVSGEQQVSVTYFNLEDLDGFAWKCAKSYERQTQYTDRLVGFCLLVRRSVVDEVGLLDEQFGIGNFEDDDWCRRAINAGWRLAIARDAFVHHFGSVSFRSSDVNFDEVLLTNEAKYLAKWNQKDKEPNDKHPQQSYSLERADDGGLLLRPQNIRLSLCMIVRDNEKTIGPCLESIKPWVDEMIVVDTGSVDRTPQICKEYGAKIFHFPWCDDFSAARNESLRHATGDWIFWMDSDDTINAANGRKLAELVQQEVDDGILGFVMQVHCPSSENANNTDMTIVDHVKLFRNRANIWFDGRIHEQVLPAIRQAGGEVAWTDTYVVHSGVDHSEEGQRRKQERDLRLLELELQDRPNHPFALFNVGMTYADMARHEQALDALLQSIEYSSPNESHVRKLYALIVCSYSELDRYDDADSWCARGLELFPDDPELLFRCGIVAHQQRRYSDAEQAYKTLLANDSERHFSSIDPGILGFKAIHNLAIVYSDSGQTKKALEQWRTVVDKEPEFRAGWRGLFQCLIGERKLDEAKSILNSEGERIKSKPEELMIRAEIARAEGRIDEACIFLQRAFDDFRDADALRLLCQILFESQRIDEAKAMLVSLVELVPHDPSAHHNLGTIELQLGDFDSAISSFRRSLELRPDYIPTLTQLGYALQSSEEIKAAVEIWEQVLEIQPSNSEALEMLDHLTLSPTE